MDCYIAESMVNKYINHTLSWEETEAFLDHIENCTSCYDELETYYIVHAVMQHLNLAESENVADFQVLLKQEIKKTRRYIRKKKFLKNISAVCVWGTLVLVIAILLFAGFHVFQHIL